MIGWIITPMGVALTLWVLFRKVEGDTLQHYVRLGIVWTLIAIAFDYVFIVKLFSPPDGYYKPDVYLYYILTLALPVIAGWMKQPSKQ
jgi:hypothetical protein